MPPEDLSGYGRPMTRQQYIGPRAQDPRTGDVYYWVEGEGYVAQNDPRRLTAQERTTLQQAQEESNQAQTYMPDLQRFEDLNRQIRTGALGQRFGLWLGDIPQVIDWWDDPNNRLTAAEERAGLEEMNQINNRMTPRQRVPGSGATSNFEGLMFRGGIPNRGFSGPGNQRAIDAARRQARLFQARAEYLEWAWPRTGNLTRAETEFNRYRRAVEQNPDLTWQEFFQVDQPSAASQPRSTQAQGATPQRRRRFNPQTGEIE